MENSYDARNKLGLGFYHLDPRWCSFEDFKYIASLGITNSYKLECGYGTTLDGVQIAKEHGAQVWLGMERFNNQGKSNETLSEYMARANRFIEKIKERELWDTVIGFHWDEPILGMTNEDFLNMSKAVSEEYGKRIFPVFSGYEATGKKGNFDDPDGYTILEGFATKYITDFGFDSYGYDFRRPYNENTAKRLALLSEEHQEITSVENYYRFYLNTLKDRMENKDARVWVFPTAYQVYTWGGYHSDEDYCIAHLENLKNILLEFDNPGGIYNYTYKTWRLSEPAMDIHLAKNNPEHWSKYEETCRKVLNEIKDIEVK